MPKALILVPSIVPDPEIDGWSVKFQVKRNPDCETDSRNVGEARLAHDAGTLELIDCIFQVPSIDIGAEMPRPNFSTPMRVKIGRPTSKT